MKRLTFLILLVFTIFSAQFLVNCSNPLEISDDANLNPEQPEVIVDTVILTDTLYLNDTTFSNDTVYIIDTTYLIDSSLIIDTIVINDTTVLIDSFIVVDSFTYTDTLFVVDSNYVDTLIIYDTSVVVDTVEIVVHDSTDANLICSQLSASLKDIIWMYNNSEGDYKLEFSAHVDLQNPVKILTVVIDNVEYTWNPFEDEYFDIEQFLGDNTTITIMPNKPAAHGHEIDICLTITPL